MAERTRTTPGREAAGIAADLAGGAGGQDGGRAEREHLLCHGILLHPMLSDLGLRGWCLMVELPAC